MTSESLIELLTKQIGYLLEMIEGLVRIMESKVSLNNRTYHSYINELTAKTEALIGTKDNAEKILLSIEGFTKLPYIDNSMGYMINFI